MYYLCIRLQINISVLFCSVYAKLKRDIQLGDFQKKPKFGLKSQPNTWRNHSILYHKTIKEASTVLCSVVN